MGLIGFGIGVILGYFTYNFVSPFFCMISKQICGFIPGFIIWAIIIAIILGRIINV